MESRTDWKSCWCIAIYKTIDQLVYFINNTSWIFVRMYYVNLFHVTAWKSWKKWIWHYPGFPVALNSPLYRVPMYKNLFLWELHPCLWVNVRTSGFEPFFSISASHQRQRQKQFFSLFIGPSWTRMSMLTVLTHWVNLTRSVLQRPVIGRPRVACYGKESGIHFENCVICVQNGEIRKI